MVKKVTLLSAILLLLLVVPSFATRHVIDDAGVFDDVAAIEEKLTELEEMLGYPSYIITTDEPFDEDPRTATDLLLMDRVGRNQNGTIFTINMATRDYQFSTSGPDLQEDKLSDKAIDRMVDGLGERLIDGDFDGAAMFYYKLLRLNLAGNYISFIEVIVSIVAALLGVGGYGGVKLWDYYREVRVKPFPLTQNASTNFLPHDDTLIDSWEIVVNISSDNNSSGSGGSSYSSSSGGGSFRGGGGKF